MFYPTPPPPKPILSLRWFFLVDEGGYQPGIYMPSSWRRCAPLPLHHCISHFSTLAHNGAKLVIVTTQEPTPIPQKGEMRKVVADYFVRRFPSKNTESMAGNIMWKWHNISIGIIWIRGKGFPVYGFWAKKNLQKTHENSSLRHLFHRLPHELFFKWWWGGKHSSESQSLHFRKTSSLFNWETRKRIWSLQNEGFFGSIALFLVLLGGELFSVSILLVSICHLYHPPVAKNQATGKKHLLH